MTAGCRYEAFPIDNVAVAGKYFWIPAIRCRSRVMLLLTFLVLIRTDSFFPPGTASGGIANRGTPRSTMRRFVPSIREGGQNGVLLTLACRRGEGVDQAFRRDDEASGCRDEGIRHDCRGLGCRDGCLRHDRKGLGCRDGPVRHDGEGLRPH